MSASWSQLLAFALILGVIIWYVLGFLRQPGSPGKREWLQIIFVLGSLLRLAYVYGTPYWVRAYDWDGHIEFVQYLLDYGALPPFDGGWEFYQAPLYYVIAAVWAKVGTLLGHDGLSLARDLQVLSLLISIVSLRLLFWIGALLFRSEEGSAKELLFVGAAASFPGVVFLSSRISNDVLAFPTALLALGMLLRWRETGALRDWIGFSLSVGLGLLSKNSALMLLPAAYATLLLARGIRFRRKVGLGCLSLTVVLLAAGWHAIPRALEEIEADVFPVGNIKSLHSDMLVDPTPWAFLRVHPIAVLREPFNDNWSDAKGRQHFWDFFYKSAFFGEFEFHPLLRSLCSVILLLGMVLLLLTPIGLVRSLRRRERMALPLLLTGLFVLAGQISLRWKYPYSPIQDFRFSLLLILPLTYFAIRGIEALPRRTSAFLFDVLYAFILLESTFLLLTAAIPQG